MHPMRELVQCSDDRPRGASRGCSGEDGLRHGSERPDGELPPQASGMGWDRCHPNGPGDASSMVLIDIETRAQFRSNPTRPEVDAAAHSTWGEPETEYFFARTFFPISGIGINAAMFCTTACSPVTVLGQLGRLCRPAGDSRREHATLLAIEPMDGKLTCEVMISYERMQAVGRRSMGHAKECGLIVPMILQKPTAIFEGLRRDEDEDRWVYGWRCYCGVPGTKFDRTRHGTSGPSLSRSGLPRLRERREGGLQLAVGEGRP